MKTTILSCLLLVATSAAVRAQGTFQNLDFELANLPDVPFGQPGGSVTIAAGLPGWAGYIGTQRVSTIIHNDLSLGDAALSILGPQLIGGVFQGKYAAVLQAGSGTPAAIAQTGQIPLNARSLVFDAVSVSLKVTFAGQQLPIIIVGEAADYNVWACDVSRHAGQTGELRFSAPPLPIGDPPPNMVYLDFIRFSELPVVPEPGSLALFGAGGLALVWRLRRQRP